MAEIDFMSVLHKSTKRDYLSRVNNPDITKAQAAQKAKKFGYDYWDGDRNICYGGYNYIEGRWEKVAQKISDYYQLPSNAKILDIGCEKVIYCMTFLKCCLMHRYLVLIFPSMQLQTANLKSEVVYKLEMRQNFHGLITHLIW